MAKSKVIKIIIGIVVGVLVIAGIIITSLNSSNDEEEKEEEDNKIIYSDYVIEVKGEVKYPGIYTVPSYAIVSDVINVAGGFTTNAYTDDINLATKVTDGLSIYVKSKDANNNSEKININTATLEQLKTLPGIANAKAQAIITYRETNGSFKTIEDIRKVNGISETTYNNIKDYITV